MEFLIYLLLIVLALLLIGIVLIQPGKGDMLSGMGGIGGQFNSMLGSSRAISTLQKITWGLAAGIIVFTLLFNYILIDNSNSSPAELKAPTEGIDVQTSTPAPVLPAPAAATEQPAQTEQPSATEENQGE